MSQANNNSTNLSISKLPSLYEFIAQLNYIEKNKRMKFTFFKSRIEAH